MKLNKNNKKQYKWPDKIAKIAVHCKILLFMEKLWNHRNNDKFNKMTSEIGERWLQGKFYLTWKNYWLWTIGFAWDFEQVSA